MAILSNFQANGQEAIKVASPTQSGTLTYTGSAQSPSWTEYPASVITITSTPQTNAGTYNATAALTAGHVWADTLKGGQRNLPWTINKHSGGVITLNKNAVALEYGESTTVTATLSSSSDTISASSSNSSVARVSVSGKTITITDGGTEGSATITVSASGNYTYTNATIAVTVTHWEATVNITTTSTEFYNQSVTVTSVVLTTPTSVTFDSTGHATYKAHIIGTYNFAITYGGKTYQKEVNVTDETTYSIKLNKSWVLTVEINMANSDPATWATYKDDAVGMTAGSDAWDEYFGHYPVLLNGTTEQGKLMTTNFDKYADGSDISWQGWYQRVMVCFPRRGLKISKSGNILSVSMTDEDNAAGYSYYAHSYKGDKCDKFYLSAFLTSLMYNNVISRKNCHVYWEKTFANERTLFENIGTGFEIMGFFQLIYIQAMYCLKYKAKNSYNTIGWGYYSDNSSGTNTGGTVTKGMDYGTQDCDNQMKLFGLEDLWGQFPTRIDGIYSDQNKKIWVSDGNFNDSGIGYIDTGHTISQNGNIKKVAGTNLSGFLISEGGGSLTTYFCDYMGANAGYGMLYGGISRVSRSGIFNSPLYDLRSNKSTRYSLRLMYMHVAT